MFDDHDDEKSKPVALVNQSAARKFWPNESATSGKRIGIGTMPSPFEVVGVIGDVKNRGVAVPPAPEVFQPYPQLPFLMVQMNVRTQMDPHSIWIRQSAHASKASIRDEPVTDVHTMEDYLETLSAPARSPDGPAGDFLGRRVRAGR